MKTAYPELPLIEKPNITTVGLEDSVHILLSQTDECLARAVFSVMYAEASRTSDKTAFKSAGNYNYSGVQTDGNRWAYSTPIVNRFWKTDVGGNYREFAGFKNNEGFFDFMINRIKAKGFDGCNADNWTETYIQKWWSPNAKAQYTKGTQKYNDKKAIFNSAMKRFDQFKQTFKGKPSVKQNTKKGFKINLFLVSFFVTFGGYFLYKNRNLLGFKK